MNDVVGKRMLSLRSRLTRSVAPVAARHAERSAVFSADDDVRPSERLITLALDSFQAARETSLEHLDERLGRPPYYASLWPGEHYRLLSALVEVLQPRTVVEIGTATGLSSLALLNSLPESGRVATFDIVPWNEYPEAILREEDFVGDRLVQHIDDLSTADGIHRHQDLLREATLVFVDAAKDGEQEQRFLDQFETVEFRDPPIVLFDDIRLWNMLEIWRGVTRPKLDITSFGHWSGTGLIDWDD